MDHSRARLTQRVETDRLLASQFSLRMLLISVLSDPALWELQRLPQSPSLLPQLSFLVTCCRTQAASTQLQSQTLFSPFPSVL